MIGPMEDSIHIEIDPATAERIREQNRASLVAAFGEAEVERMEAGVDAVDATETVRVPDEFVNIRTEDDVTDAHLDAARGFAEQSDTDGEPLTKEDLIDYLDGSWVDGKVEDWGSDLESPAIEKVYKEARKHYRALRAAG